MSSSRRGGGVSRRCECRGPDGKRLGSACPQMAKRNHGLRQIRQELPALAGENGTEERKIFRRTGYTTVTDAEADLDKVRDVIALAGDDTDAQQRITRLLVQVAAGRAPIPDPEEVRRKLGVGVELDGRLTIGDLLTQWLAGKQRRSTTLRGYGSHVRVHLVPHLGHLRADRLNDQHVAAMFLAINDQNEVILAENAARREQEARCRYAGGGALGRPKGEERIRLAAERAKLAAMPPYRRITGPMTQQRIRATLRSALNSPLGRRYVTVNPATRVEMLTARRPKALLWTPGRVARWRETGEVPSPVMVWTPEQAGEFLDSAEGHDLYALYYLISFRGLRRGEAVGQDDADVDLDNLLLTVSQEVVQDGWDAVESDPKTDGSAATIALDVLTAEVLRAYRARRVERRAKWIAADAERIIAGEPSRPWQDTGKFFAAEDGAWIHPDTASKEFRKLSEKAGLPPINLRDLRHLAATLIHAGGGDLFAVAETLRHTSIKLAGEIYTSLLTEVDRSVAEAASRVVPRARKPVEE